MKEFFGWDGYTREAEGFLSWQHLSFVTALMIIMVALAVFFGRRMRDEDEKRVDRFRYSHRSVHQGKAQADAWISY